MKLKVKDISTFLDDAVPLSWQESYDNSGLQTGNPENEVSSALLSLEATEDVVREAVEKKCGMIITHHPVIFHPLKKLTGKTVAERVLIEAVNNGIAIYSSHTNLDVHSNGVSRRMAEKLGLKEIRPLRPLENKLYKLVTYVPSDYADRVRDAIFSAGAGVIGNYDLCSFNSSGFGTFRGNEESNPFAGEKGVMHREQEIRIETILLSHLRGRVIKALLEAHPYEEVAWDLFPLVNDYEMAGTGSIGTLPTPVEDKVFPELVARIFNAELIKHSQARGRFISKVAVCGGAGSSFIDNAIAADADAYITGEIRYHDFLNSSGSIFLVETGHYESEICSLEILYELLIKKFPTFALRFSEIKSNPINYYSNGKNKTTGD